MSFVDAGGVSKWSQVSIDADKDMLTFGISDLKELVAGMTPGDLLYFSPTTGKIAKLSPGIITTQLLTKNITHPPAWGYPDVGAWPP